MEWRKKNLTKTFNVTSVTGVRTNNNKQKRYKNEGKSNAINTGNAINTDNYTHTAVTTKKTTIPPMKNKNGCNKNNNTSNKYVCIYKLLNARMHHNIVSNACLQFIDTNKKSVMKKDPGTCACKFPFERVYDQNKKRRFLSPCATLS